MIWAATIDCYSHPFDPQQRVAMSRRLCALISQIASAAAKNSSASRMGAALLPEAAAAQQSSLMGAYRAAAVLPMGLGGAWGPAAVARAVSTSGFALSSNLPSVLKQEISHEKESYAKPQEIAAGPPAPFTLSTASDSDTLITLKRAYNGEEVCVDLHVNNQPAQEFEGEDASEDEVLSMVSFNVTVTKGDKSLVFECESNGTYVAINHLSLEPKDGQPSESCYTGPVFAELDEVLQTELRQYLQDRGITEELGEYLRHLIYDREQVEYMNWLQGVHDFVK